MKKEMLIRICHIEETGSHNGSCLGGTVNQDQFRGDFPPNDFCVLFGFGFQEVLDGRILVVIGDFGKTFRQDRVLLPVSGEIRCGEPLFTSEEVVYPRFGVMK
jgi:hypothetical protein